MMSLIPVGIANSSSILMQAVNENCRLKGCKKPTVLSMLSSVLKRASQKPIPYCPDSTHPIRTSLIYGRPASSSDVFGHDGLLAILDQRSAPSESSQCNHTDRSRPPSRPG